MSPPAGDFPRVPRAAAGAAGARWGNPATPYAAVSDHRDFPANYSTPLAATGHTLVAQREYYIPVWFPYGRVYTELSVYVNTLAAASAGVMALYARGANRAMGTQLARATFDPTGTGIKSATIAPLSVPEGWLWFGIWSDAAPVMRAATPSFASMGGGLSGNLFVGNVGFVRVSITPIGSALPAVAPTTSLSVLGGQALTVPMLGTP
jgi:hypothetical protein